MIYYELKDWLVDSANECRVHEIIERCIFSDINLPEQIDNAVRELRQLGESIIADKLDRREVCFPFLA